MAELGMIGWIIALGFYASRVIVSGYNFVLMNKELVRLLEKT